jgi:hypothetical protein
MSHVSRRRYRKSQDRRVWVFSELNHDLTPEQMAKIIVIAGLERAREEAARRALTESEQQPSRTSEEEPDGTA